MCVCVCKMCVRCVFDEYVCVRLRQRKSVCSIKRMKWIELTIKVEAADADNRDDDDEKLS